MEGLIALACAGLIIELNCKIIVKSVSKLILVLGMMLPLSSLAQRELTNAFDKLLYTSGKEGRLPYRLLKPETVEPGKKYPLVIFLHGAGERGADNEMHIQHITEAFLDSANRRQFPCYLIAPQCPENVMWASHDRDGKIKPEPSPVMKLVIGLIEKTEKKFPIDETRIYITGLSMGGYGAWDLLARYPNRFAAAVPICGGGDPETARSISHIPIWAFHGSMDPVVLPKNSRRMIKALQAAGGNPGYTEYPAVGHNSWEYAYRDPYLFPWIFGHRRQKNSDDK